MLVTGSFGNTVDFDPGPGINNKSTNGGLDSYLLKFDTEGDFSWVQTWGSTSQDSARLVETDASDNIYLTGVFRESADFDPGPGQEIHTSNGYYDCYLSKFSSAGVHQWTKTWGGTTGDFDEANGLSVCDLTGKLHVTGWFADVVDFDPGPGVDSHTSNGYRDLYINTFNLDGNFLWAVSWGGSDDTFEESFEVTHNQTGDVFVTGFFGDADVDFDPGTGVDLQSSNGLQDAFLIKFDSNGNYKWSRVWGGFEDDRGHGVGVDLFGDIYCTGYFNDSVNFAPCDEFPAIDVTNGNNDAFLVKFKSDGCW